MNKRISRIQEARKIISQDENLERNYFEKVPTNWINDLYKEKMLDISESVYGAGSDQYFHHWIAGKYFLTRSATEYPEETLHILNEQITNKISNPVVISDLYDIILNLVGNISIDPLIEKMRTENWLRKVNIRNSASFTIEDIANKLIARNEYKTLSMFLTYVLLFQNLKRGNYNSTETVIDDYDYQNILKSINIVEYECINDLQIILDSLAYALNSYSEIEKGRKSNLQEKEYNDLSYIWINKVYEIDNELVITSPRALVQTISQLLEQNKSILTESLLESLNKYNFGVFKRIKLYGYSLISPDLVSNKLAILKEPLSDYHNLLEWEKTAKNLYPYLNINEKGTLLEHINSLYNDYGVKEAVVRRGYVLNCLKEFLTPEDKKTFKDILEKSRPYLGAIISSEMKSGPNSPISSEKLATKSIEEQIEFFIDSEKKADSYQWERDLLSPEGIARQWVTVIKKDPERYINDLSKFRAEDLPLTYISHLLQALEESDTDITKAIDYIDSLIKVYSSDNLHQYKGKADAFDVGTPSELLISILRFLEKTIKDRIPYKDEVRKRIFSLIENLRVVSSNEREDWIDANGKEYFTHSLNSTPGLFMHLLYSYMIWVVKNDSNSEIPKEVIELIKLQNHEYPENKTIRSVEGEYLTNFGDNPFFQELKAYLLPKDNKELRYIAWETYLTRQVYLKIFEDFYDLYTLAIEEIGNIPDRKYWSNPEERLVEHIAIAYLHGNKKAKELWGYLLDKKDYPSIAYTVSFIGRVFILREDAKSLNSDKQEKILEIWETLLRKNFRGTKIYEEFGWWVEKDFFSKEEVILNNLLKTLSLSEGAIEPSHRVIKSLADFSKEFPLEVSNILLEMVNNRQPENIYFLDDKEVLDLINYLESTDIDECVLNMKKTREILVGKGFKQYKA